MTKQNCQAPWNCSRLTAKAEGKPARRIGNKQLCRPCYQYVWGYAHRLNKSLEYTIGILPVPDDKSYDMSISQCQRPGCGSDITHHRRQVTLPGGQKIQLCRPCYQLTWEWAKELNISTEEAYLRLPKKRFRK